MTSAAGSRAFETALSTFLDTARRAPDAPCVHHGEESVSFACVDRMSDALAEALRHRGVTRWERVVLLVGDNPWFVVAQLAVWKVGACVVPLDPALDGEALHAVIADCAPVAAVVGTDDERGVAPLPGGEAIAEIIAVPRQWTDADVPAASDPVGGATPVSVNDIAYVLYDEPRRPRPRAVAMTHANVVAGSEAWRRWCETSPGDTFLLGAPVWAVPSLVGGIAVGHRAAMPVVLCDPSDGGDVARQCRLWKPTTTVAPSGALASLVAAAENGRVEVASLTKAFSVGRGLTPELLSRWVARTGSPIHYARWDTASASPTHAWPLGVAAPVDPATGEFSVGVRMPEVEARLVDPVTGSQVPRGAVGDLWIRGPGVTRTWWPGTCGMPVASWFVRTSERGRVDDAGWFHRSSRMPSPAAACGGRMTGNPGAFTRD